MAAAEEGEETALALLVVLLVAGSIIITPLISVWTSIAGTLRNIDPNSLVNVTVPQSIANTSEYHSVTGLTGKLSGLAKTLLTVLADPRGAAALLAAGIIYTVYEASRRARARTGYV